MTSHNRMYIYKLALISLMWQSESNRRKLYATAIVFLMS